MRAVWKPSNRELDLKENHTLVDSITAFFVPIHKDGYKFVAGFAVAALVASLLSAPLGGLGAVATLWCAYFFRDPERFPPKDKGIIVAPADGRISAIEDVVPPNELDLDNAKRTRISIFLSVFDVHINRSPVAGKITKIVYVPGKFLNAELDKASDENERQCLTIETKDGSKIGCVQIAGLIARRIVTFVQQGDSIATGERFGLIRFGSRTDIYLPPGVKPIVRVGQTAIGGETVLSSIGSGKSRS
ncbi:MAG: phosphatidylserine decarboxylase [Proteobacteria bacterium]|nr:phosphatidylserine decarboxylase [Pseudomonadota bacterium]